MKGALGTFKNDTARCKVRSYYIITMYTCTFADSGVELRESSGTDTFEGADGVATGGMIVTRIIGGTFVDVVVTVPSRVAVKTLRTSGCFVAHRVTVATVAVSLTFLAPPTARTGCNHTCRIPF